MEPPADAASLDSYTPSSGDLPQRPARPHIPDLFAIREMPTQLAQEIVQQFHYRQSKAPARSLGLPPGQTTGDALPYQQARRWLFP